MKHWTPEEVDALIPELEGIFAAVAELVAQAETKAAALRDRADAGRVEPAAEAIERAQLQFLSRAIDQWMTKIVELGGQPKGVDPALVDFPARVDGREAYLCWRLGEKRVTHYHGVEEGFAGRRPLPKRRSS